MIEQGYERLNFLLCSIVMSGLVIGSLGILFDLHLLFDIGTIMVIGSFLSVIIILRSQLRDYEKEYGKLG